MASFSTTSRRETFVTRKITRAIARIALGLQDKLHLGNMDALRDWGHAKDYVEMQWMMLQQDTPEDFVIATGEQHSVREFVQRSAAELGMEITFSGEGVDEVGTVTGVSNPELTVQPGQQIVGVDPRYFRPAEVETLLGDPTKAKEKLGWVPKITFEELVKDMITSDFEHAKRDRLVTEAGYRAFDYNE